MEQAEWTAEIIYVWTAPGGIQMTVRMCAANGTTRVASGVSKEKLSLTCGLMEVRLTLAITLARCRCEHAVLIMFANDYRRAVGIQRIHASGLHESILAGPFGVIYRCLPFRLRKRWYGVVD